MFATVRTATTYHAYLLLGAPASGIPKLSEMEWRGRARCLFGEEDRPAIAAPTAHATRPHTTFLARGHHATETSDIRRVRARDVGAGGVGAARTRRPRTDGRTATAMPSGRGLA